MTFTFYWHDYETWGSDPMRDRAAQFAGLRTDADLNVIEKPQVIYCRPADDMLPHPEACLITGITPQFASEKGVNEAKFFQLIHSELARPGTCGVGYNNLRFDDEVTRFGLYRNFYDPYAREWQNGNSRWDIIDMVRLTHALRPQGINWPSSEDGVPNFRLERLTAANGIAHQGAHDALSDVHATISLAKLIKTRQPRLYEYIFRRRDKHSAGNMLNFNDSKPLLHVSSRYPARLGAIAMVVPLARHPTNSNGVIVYDLRYDPTPFIELSVDEIRERLFTPNVQLPEGVERIPLKTVHLNKCPVLAPMSTLTDEAAERWKIDPDRSMIYLDRLRNASNLEVKIDALFKTRDYDSNIDPDIALYAGGFFSNEDRKRIDKVRLTPVEELGKLHFSFDDSRLPELLFRYRARNWLMGLSSDERVRWESYRRQRLADPETGITPESFSKTLAKLMVAPELDKHKKAILSQLADWPVEIGL